MEIVHCDEEILSNIPSIMQLLYDIYGDTDIQVFATLDENKLGFIARVGNYCTFINHRGEYTLFTVTDEDELSTIYKKPYTINFDGGAFLVDDNRVEHILDFNQRPYPDEEGYDGLVTYKQYDIDRDIMCEMNFQQMYREDKNGIAPVYTYHTKEIDTLFIDEDYEKRGAGSLKVGPIPKKSYYYSKVKYNSEELGYKLMAIADYGLAEYLSKGPYELMRDQTVVRYSRITRVKFNGEFGDRWPLGEQISPCDLDKKIEEYGFSREIPPLLLSIHNGYEKCIDEMAHLCSEMARVKKIYLEPGNTDLCMTLKLVLGENEQK